MDAGLQLLIVEDVWRHGVNDSLIKRIANVIRAFRGIRRTTPLVTCFFGTGKIAGSPTDRMEAGYGHINGRLARGTGYKHRDFAPWLSGNVRIEKGQRGDMINRRQATLDAAAIRSRPD